MLQAIVHAANIQDRDGGAMLLATLFEFYPFLLKLYADGGYQGPEFRKALAAIFAQVDVEIVKRSDVAKGFCRVAQAMGGGPSACLARPVSTIGKGLGVPQRKGAGVPADGVHTPHGQKAMPQLIIWCCRGCGG